MANLITYLVRDAGGTPRMIGTVEPDCDLDELARMELEARAAGSTLVAFGDGGAERARWARGPDVVARAAPRGE